MFRVPDSKCPKCGVTHVAASTIKQDIPKPGHLAVCTRCGALNRFNQEMALEELSEPQWRLLPLQTRQILRSMQRAVHALN